MPFGFDGILHGAALCFYALTVLDAIASTDNIVICAPSGFGRRLACFGRNLACFAGEKGRCIYFTAIFLIHLSCRERNSTSSSFHLLDHGDLHLHLLFGIFWCLSGIHPRCALPPDSASRPFATNCSPELVAPRQILRDYWDPL